MCIRDRATAGLALYLLTAYGLEAMQRGVVIAYDSRVNSQLFAREAALTLNSFGIRAYVFDRLTPTPELSFAVNYRQAAAGIVITASHNPKEYNCLLYTSMFDKIHLLYLEYSQ